MPTGLIEERTLPYTDPAAIRSLVKQSVGRMKAYGMGAPKDFPDNINTIRVSTKGSLFVDAIHGRITLVAIRGGHRVVLEWEKNTGEARSFTEYFWRNLGRVAVPGGIRSAPLSGRLTLAATLSFVMALFSLIYFAVNNADWRAAEYEIGGLYWFPVAMLGVISAFGAFGGILIVKRIWYHIADGAVALVFLSCFAPLVGYHTGLDSFIWEPVALSYVKTALAVIIVVCITSTSKLDFES